ncbi:MAG TPA: hypothetical protein VGJ02_00320 [Pyrinomonadaceae bacterium]
MSKRNSLAAIFILTVSAIVIAGQDMPKPKLSFVRAEDVTDNSRQYMRYTIEITNRSEFSDELFFESPDLPACGLNANSSRTWINIYFDGGRRYYGWCAIRSNAELSMLKFNVPADAVQPTKIYVDFVDRREGKVVKSNKVDIHQ